MWYVYESHLTGNLYSSSFKHENEDLYCEQCGESDSLVGVFDSEEEATTYIEKYNKSEFELE